MKEKPLPYSDEKAYRIAYLVLAYLRKTLTEAEHDELDAWVEESDENMLLFEELTDEKNMEANLAWMQSIDTEGALAKAKKQVQFTPAKNRKKRLWSFIAAAALVTVMVAFYFVQPKKATHDRGRVPVAVSDVAPGGNKATLTLSNGTVVNLEEKSTGLIQKETGTKIEKTADGSLMYEKLTPTSESHYNTVEIPKGGQYALTLSDGTKVWLNALSSLKFPEQFSGSLRVVELTGEAYFQVSKDRQHPFIVKLPDAEQVKVLGTQFNVSSYRDEEIKKVTLVEGSVQITLAPDKTSTAPALGERSVMMTPGQQARILNGNVELEKHADIEAATGWKDGSFVFRDADIYSIMQQAERWYDVNVIYRTTSSEHFNFSISRKEPLSKILHLMELTGKIHFKIENKNVYVLP